MLGHHALGVMPLYRGQGLANEVVSAATAYILEQGRLASAKVCRALGYVEYAT